MRPDSKESSRSYRVLPAARTHYWIQQREGVLRMLLGCLLTRAKHETKLRRERLIPPLFTLNIGPAFCVIQGGTKCNFGDKNKSTSCIPNHYLHQVQ